jgi:hypothetical protein
MKKTILGLILSQIACSKSEILQVRQQQEQSILQWWCNPFF